MANVKGKAVDTTYLRVNTEATKKGYIHRDYLAHCLRWSHVIKYLHQGAKYKTAHVLDVGCGREAPLPRSMFSMMLCHTTGSYTGVDYGPVPWPDTISETTKRFKMKLFGETDFVEWTPTRKSFDVITSFEVLEHVEAEHAYAMLVKMRGLLARDGRCFLSTPCYDPKVGAADNHVNEMSYAGFKALIHLAGFEVDGVWGTFASQKDYKKLLDEPTASVFEQLHSYYDSNVLACIFAPLFPAQARNCLWRLRAGKPVRLQPLELKCLAKPEHGSSELWPKQLKKIAQGI